jgi:RNA recognition motif-containing protein
MNIYVGNLAYQVTSEELRKAFEQFGEVSSASVVTDKFTGQSKGFGFVEMPDKAKGEEAIKQLDGSALKGRNIRVNEARPRQEGGGGGGGGARRSGGPRRF